MLKGIAACISPALLQVLSEMGCGDTLVLAGANFPAAACAKETILLRADGVGTLPLLEGILKLMPLDENVPNPMQLVERTSVDGDLPVPLWEDYKAIVTQIAPRRKHNSRRGKKEVRIPRKIPGERIYKRKKMC